jgi:hypothetical protein
MYILKKDIANQKIKFFLKDKTYSSASVEIRSFQNSQLQESTAVIPDFSGTTTADVGQGSENLDVVNVSDASEIEKGYAFITDPEGFSELLNIIGVDTTNNSVYFAGYPNRKFDTGSTITSASASIVVEEDVYNTEQDFYVIFSYFSENEIVSWQESGYVHPRPAGNPLSIQKIYQKFPQLKDNQFNSNKSKTYEEILKNSFDSIRSRLLSNERKIEMYKGSTSALEDVIFYQFSLDIATIGFNPFAEASALEFYEKMNEKLMIAWNSLILSRQWVDTDEDDIEEIEERQKTGRRLIW